MQSNVQLHIRLHTYIHVIDWNCTRPQAYRYAVLDDLWGWNVFDVYVFIDKDKYYGMQSFRFESSIFITHTHIHFIYKNILLS